MLLLKLAHVMERVCLVQVQQLAAARALGGQGSLRVPGRLLLWVSSEYQSIIEQLPCVPDVEEWARHSLGGENGAAPLLALLGRLQAFVVFQSLSTKAVALQVGRVLYVGWLVGWLVG